MDGDPKSAAAMGNKTMACGGDTTLEDEIMTISRSVTYPGAECKDPSKVYGKPTGAVPSAKASWHDGAASVTDPDAPERAPLETKTIRKPPPNYRKLGDEVLSVPRPIAYPSAACKNADKVYGKPDGAMPANKASWHGDGAAAVTDPDAPERGALETKTVRKPPPNYRKLGDEVLSVPRSKAYPSATCKDADKVYGKPQGAMPAEKTSWHGDGAVAAKEPEVSA